MNTVAMDDFSVFVPNGWAVFDLTQPLERQLVEPLRELQADVPEQVRGAIGEAVADSLRQTLGKLASRGALRVYMPARNPALSHILPVYAVRPADFLREEQDSDPLDYLVALLSTGEYTVVEPQGLVGVRHLEDRDSSQDVARRIESLPAAVLRELDPERFPRAVQDGRRTRHLEYLVGEPRHPTRWLQIAASISVPAGEASDDVLEAMTRLADNWVNSLAWVPAPDVRSS